MHSSTLDPLVPLKGVFASPAQACYLPDRCHEQIYQDSFTFLDEEDQNITECHILVLDELPPSAPRIGSAPLPFAPTELPRRAMVSLRRTPMIEMEDDDQDTTRNSHEVGISDQTQQPPPPPHGNPTPLPASTRPVGRSKGSKRFPRVVHPQTTHPEVFQSITCAPTLRHMSFEELRQECYLLSSVCKGGPPGPVAPGEWNLIPPKFEPYVSDTKADATSLNGQLGLEIGHEAKEVIMSDQPNLASTFTFTASLS